MSSPGLFAPGAPKLRTIPPGANFLRELARALAAEKGLASNAAALADDLIYVPNRRSARALALALFEAAGGISILMPDIRPLGDLETDEPPPGAEAALAGLLPAISPAARLGRLARLVSAFYQGQGKSIPPASALAAARELARLLDQAALSGKIEWDRLHTLVEDRQLAEHWEKSLKFLDIIITQWPGELERDARMDPYARRLAAAEAMAAQWLKTPPRGNVILAGSTGADPSGRTLMKAALQLDRSLIVLPGLDRTVSADALSAIACTPSHPQFALVQTLDALGYSPDETAPWPGLSDTTQARARRALIHEALAPADETSGWLERLGALAGAQAVPAFARDGLSGLTLIEAADETDEAWCAALLMRETLETERETAALVTPDAGLARRVSALLRQWQIGVAPSAGTPLLQTPAGSLAALVMDWTADVTDPVRLLSVMKHAQITGRQEIESLERFFLRGPRRWTDWESLAAHIRRVAADKAQARRSGLKDEHADMAGCFVEELRARFSDAGLGESDRPQDGATWLEAVSNLMSALGASPLPWAGKDGAALSGAMRDFALICESLPEAPPEVWSELFRAHCQTLTVRGPAGEHPRLAIWGPLEARLQSADRLILAGLNEGVWPAQPPADAFLPRSFRHEIGLDDPDERIGLSAHDFAQMAAAPNVILLSARRRDDAPAVASRWLWRLNTLARGALGEKGARDALSPQPEDDPRRWLKALRQAPSLDGFKSEPRPTPAVRHRPTGLSVTRIETLQRDPYAIYAQYVLRLTKLDPLDMPMDARPRGTAIHAALEKFELEADKSPARLIAMLEQELRDAGEAEETILGAAASRRKVAANYIAWRAERLGSLVGAPYTEIYGDTEIPVPGQQDLTFRLSATADRIERHKDGSLVILDFKSGAPPGEGEVRTGLNPQMPLQAIIALAQGFRDQAKMPLEANAVSALTYVRFGAQFNVRNIGDKSGPKHPEKPLHEIIEETRDGFRRLITKFASPDHPYVSMPRPKWATYGSDYARLARREEWAAEEGDD